MGAKRGYEKLADSRTAIKHITSSATATYALTPEQVTTVVDATDNTGHITVELPPLDAPGVPGKIFHIGLTTRATSNVLIKDANGLATLYTLDATGEDIDLYSNGLEWRPLAGTYS